MSLEIVNVVGAGQLNTELDLENLANDIDAYSVKYDPEFYPGMYVEISEDSPTITVYTNGKYHITGSKSTDELFETRDDFLLALDEHSINYSIDDDEFGIKNLVCTTEYESELNLHTLSVGLGLENVEYEPEIFPSITYRLPDSEAVILIFRTGKLVIQGVTSFEDAKHAYQEFKSVMNNLS